MARPRIYRVLRIAGSLARQRCHRICVLHECNLHTNPPQPPTTHDPSERFEPINGKPFVGLSDPALSFGAHRDYYFEDNVHDDGTRQTSSVVQVMFAAIKGKCSDLFRIDYESAQMSNSMLSSPKADSGHRVANSTRGKYATIARPYEVNPSLHEEAVKKHFAPCSMKQPGSPARTSPRVAMPFAHTCSVRSRQITHKLGWETVAPFSP